VSARIVAVCAALWLGAAAGVSAEGEGAAAAPGAALRAALELRAAGDAAAAAERFAALAITVPELADHASELRIEGLVHAGQPDAALAEAQAFRTRFGDSWLRGLVAAHEGAAQVARGDEGAARAAFADALRLQADTETDLRARLLSEIAASHERSGEPALAAERWREVWTRYVTSAEAAHAEQALVRLAAQDPALIYRTPAAAMDRCFRLSAALRNEEALAGCDAALAAVPGERSLLRERAEILFRLRRYPAAAEAFAALGDDPSASFWRARSLARAGRVESSLEAFARLAAGPDRELAARARFLSGTLLEDTDLNAAEASYRQVAEQAPAAEQRSAARWRLVWLAWRRGDFEAAASGLEAYAADAPDAAERMRGRYWLGRALGRLGRSEGREQLDQIAGAEPLSYYGWRAASLLPADEPAAVAAAPALAGALATAALPDVAPLPEAPPTAPLPEVALRRIQILLEGGLDERATHEIRRLGSAANTQPARLVLAQLLLEAGRFHLAQRLVLTSDTGALVRRPPAGEEAFWWLAWPTAYDGSVERAAHANGIEPALVYAIMREESGYQPDALSVAGARGLTQIMPDTGRRLASDLGATAFDPAELFVPERNLELGAFYLSQLVGRFGGRFSAAIASYNAGPEAVARWLAADAAREDDEWVESIPYDQTRGYVKRVLRSVHVYRTLYGS